MRTMRRRDFLLLFGALTFTGTVAARAQQPRVPVVGFLGVGTTETVTAYLAAWRKSLREAGFIEGKNLSVEYRWAQNDDQLPALAAELVHRRADVIQTVGGAAARVVKTATATIPIVFWGANDPVAQGLVKSIQLPGGNVTGAAGAFDAFDGKRLQLLREVVPAATRIGYLVNPENKNAVLHKQQGEAAAQALGINTIVLTASREEELELAIAAGVNAGITGLLLADEVFFYKFRRQLAELATRYAVPTVCPSRDFVEDGGLMSYGRSIEEFAYQAGAYVGRILKGEKPADLPIIQPTKFELVINLKTAKVLGLSMPPTLLARADEVIE
jgi:putative ABC transport system substrate-binding protein